jgi:hypothetical protein
MENGTEKFQVGESYACRSIGDWNCIFSGRVVKRTAKTITLKMHGREEFRRRVKIQDGVETVEPLGAYSMSPTFHADRTLARVEGQS